MRPYAALEAEINEVGARALRTEEASRSRRPPRPRSSHVAEGG